MTEFYILSADIIDETKYEFKRERNVENLKNEILTKNKEKNTNHSAKSAHKQKMTNN